MQNIWNDHSTVAHNMTILYYRYRKDTVERRTIVCSLIACFVCIVSNHCQEEITHFMSFRIFISSGMTLNVARRFGVWTLMAVLLISTELLL